MQITVNLTPGSYALMARNMQAKLLLRVRIFSAVMGSVFALIVCLVGKLTPGGMPLTRTFLVFTVVFFILYGVGIRLLYGFQFNRLGECFYGDITFESKDDGLHISNGYFHKIFQYRAFIDVVDAKTQLLILTGKSAGFHLPISAENRHAVLEFGYDLLKRMGANKAASATGSPITTA